MHFRNSAFRITPFEQHFVYSKQSVPQNALIKAGFFYINF